MTKLICMAIAMGLASSVIANEYNPFELSILCKQYRKHCSLHDVANNRSVVLFRRDQYRNIVLPLLQSARQQERLIKVDSTKVKRGVVTFLQTPYLNNIAMPNVSQENALSLSEKSIPFTWKAAKKSQILLLDFVVLKALMITYTDSTWSSHLINDEVATRVQQALLSQEIDFDVNTTVLENLERYERSNLIKSVIIPASDRQL